MPANKRRSRNGNGNSTTSLSSSSSLPAHTNLKSSNPITKIFNNLNGFANDNNYNGYHPIPVTVNHQVIQSSPTVIANTTSTFTAKQQQQLDRNAFLLTLTKDQLKVECRKRGQKTTGTKTELVFRLVSVSLKCVDYSIPMIVVLSSIHLAILCLSFFFRSIFLFNPRAI